MAVSKWIFPPHSVPIQLESDGSRVVYVNEK